MPEVKKCDVAECYYNKNNLCHANAILVGSSHPMCDTFVNSGGHALPAENGSVGACHQSDCTWNNELSCHADGIDVGHHADHADCLTYEQR